MNSVIDIENKQLTFNGKNVFMILDDKNNPGFKGIDIAEILKYKNIRQAIRVNVDEDDKIILDNFKNRRGYPIASLIIKQFLPMNQAFII